MNILLINHYAGSNKHGMEYRPFYFSREWVKLGHRVTIAASSFSHLRSQAPTTLGHVTEEEIEGIRYVWLKTPDYQGNGIGRIFNILSFIGKLYQHKTRLLRDCRPDVVIASSTYPLDIFPARNIARKAQARLIFEIHDLWPLTPIELGGMSPWHPYILLMQMAENYAYRVADRVVSMLPKADSYMRKHGMAAYKFAYLPHGIDVEEWEKKKTPIPREHCEVLSRLRNNGHFIVGYAGSHGLANALHTFIETASLLHGYPVTFVLVGQGPEKAALQKKVSELGLTNTIFLPPVPRSCIPELMASMDALFIGYQKKSLYRFGISPNKLMDYMMAAKPVIHAIEAGNDLVAESGCGFSVPPENPAAVAEAVIKLIKMETDQRDIIGLKGRNYVLKNHNYTVLAKQFLEVITGQDFPGQNQVPGTYPDKY